MNDPIKTSCECERPMLWIDEDDFEIRCLKCGKPETAAPAPPMERKPSRVKVRAATRKATIINMTASGASAAEIARELDTTPATVRVEQHRIRHRDPHSR